MNFESTKTFSFEVRTCYVSANNVFIILKFEADVVLVVKVFQFFVKVQWWICNINPSTSDCKNSMC